MILLLTALLLAAPWLALIADHAAAATPLNNRSNISNTAPKAGNGTTPSKTK